MVAYDEDLLNAFRSERLVYRKFETTEEDKAFIVGLHDDPSWQAMTSNRLMHPKTKADAERFIVWSQKRLLVVAACLLPEENTSESDVDKANVGDGEKKVPIPIGFVGLHSSEEMDAINREAPLSIGIAQEYRGKGYGGEMINWIVDVRHSHLSLHRASEQSSPRKISVPGDHELAVTNQDSLSGHFDEQHYIESLLSYMTLTPTPSSCIVR
jgi:RimJ/RimL family protein N-acetyltransferase